MDNDYMERMARAYNEELRTVSGGSTGLYDTAIELIEQQLDLINFTLGTVRQQNRALAYVRALKQQDLRELLSLSKSNGVATYREKQRCPSNICNRIIDLQVELFITLDRLRERGEPVENIILNETRAAAMLALAF